MAKITVNDLNTITQRVQKEKDLSKGAGRAKVTVHMGTCGIAAGAEKIMAALADEFKKRALNDCILTYSGCAGLCSLEPMATVELKGEDPVLYADLTPEKILKILQNHVLQGNVVKEYALAKGFERIV